MDFRKQGKVVGIALGDLLQITDFQDYLGEQVLNVYYYRWASAPVLDNSAYEPLVNDFAAKVITPSKQLQNDGLTHVNITVKNLTNGVDFGDFPNGVIGDIVASAAERLPSFIALSFQLVRDSLVTRNGSKRIAGLVDAQVEENEFVGSPGDIVDVEFGMHEPLSVGLLDVAFPIIVKRPIPVPATAGYLYSSVSSVNFKGIGTQNTRKKGRGA